MLSWPRGCCAYTDEGQCVCVCARAVTKTESSQCNRHNCTKQEVHWALPPRNSPLCSRNPSTIMNEQRLIETGDVATALAHVWLFLFVFLFVSFLFKTIFKCNPPKSGPNPIMSSISTEIDIPSVVCVIY